MKGDIFSFDFWVRAENFYTALLPAAAILLLTGVMVLLFVFQYAGPKSKVRKIASRIFLPVLFFSILGGWMGHRHYSLYLEQASLVNPLIRDRERILGMDRFVWGTERKMYQQLNDFDALRELLMYKEEPVKEYIDYLGKNGHVHYFSDGERTMKHTGTVQYINENTHLSGRHFSLNEPRFQEIGFQNSLPAMLEAVKINELESEKQYRPNNSYNVRSLEESIPGWNF